MVQADRVDRDHSNAPRHFLVQRAHLILQGVIALHQLAAALVIGLSLGREHERPLGAINQLHSQAALQLIDDLAGTRLRDPVLVGGPREASPADDIAEDL